MKRKIGAALRMMAVYKNWLHLFLYRLDILPKPMIIEARDGSKIFVRSRKEPADAYVVNESWLYGIHDALLPYMKEAKIGIDLGAHIGTFSVWAAKRSSAKIYAFEPAPRNLEVLYENIRLNKLEDRINVIPVAVFSSTGEKELYITENSGLISMVSEHHRNRADAGKLLDVLRVPSISLQDFFSREKIEVCDFMKVDVEGGEYEIFMNLPDDIYQRIRSISMEIGGKHSELIEHITSRGFKVYKPHEEFDEYIFIR